MRFYVFVLNVVVIVSAFVTLINITYLPTSG